MEGLPEPLWCDTYQAPDPRVPWTAMTWLKKIALRTFFPPVLVWDTLGLLLRGLFSRRLSRDIVPAQRKRFEKHEKWPGELKTETRQTPGGTVYLQRLRVDTYDRARLDTLEVTPDSIRSTPVARRRYIIEFAGNTDCCELFKEDMITDAAKLGSTIIGFNYRGVRHSNPAPRSRDDLLIDGMAQVQRLLDKGVPPENIILKGHSLGGALATLVAKRFHDAEKPVCLFNDRSFSTLSNVVAGRLRTIAVSQNTGHHETWFGRVLSWICKPVIRLVLALTNWEMNAAAAYRAIPARYKDYTVIRSAAEDRGQNFMDDTVIPHIAALHTDPSITALRRAEKHRLKTAIVAMEGKTILSEKDTQRLNDWYVALARLKERKIPGIPHEPNTRCHHVRRLSSLTVRRHLLPGTMSASEFFAQFFYRVSPRLPADSPASSSHVSPPGISVR